MVAGWILIILGLFFLADQLNLLPPIEWSLAWPVILIMIGIYVVAKRSGCCGWWGDKKDNKPGQK